MVAVAVSPSLSLSASSTTKSGSESESESESSGGNNEYITIDGPTDDPEVDHEGANQNVTCDLLAQWLEISQDRHYSRHRE